MKTVPLEVNAQNLEELLKHSSGWPHTCINPAGMSREQVIQAEERTTDRRCLFIHNNVTGQGCRISGLTFRQAFANLRWKPGDCNWVDVRGSPTERLLVKFGAGWPRVSDEFTILDEGKE